MTGPPVDPFSSFDGELLSIEEATKLGIRGSSSDDPSGAKLAQEAHDAGAVVPVVELPVHRVVIDFRVHGSLAFARELESAIVETLLEHPEILSPVSSAVDAGLEL